MNLYLIRQESNHNYSIYWGAVVAAYSEEIAKDIHPDGRKELIDWRSEECGGSDWVKERKNVIIEFIGIAKADKKQGVIFSSYHD